jgi:DNA-directed RNA polymerase subunit RPC12/RpoP
MEVVSSRPVHAQHTEPPQVPGGSAIRRPAHAGHGPAGNSSRIDRLRWQGTAGMVRGWLLALVVCAMLASVAYAQAETLTLDIAKSWGYAWRGEMQGAFTLKVSGPPDLDRVTFLLDGAPLAEVAAPPFTLLFTTDSYPLGSHVLSAGGVTTGGQELRAADVTVTFVGADRGIQIALRIGGPILVVVLGFVAITAVLSVVGDRRRQPTGGTTPNYGRMGGAVCPKCGRPFALRLLSLNLMTRRYDRCPHCGAWSLVRTSSPAELRAAEAPASGAADGTSVASSSNDNESELRHALEESRYVDE